MKEVEPRFKPVGLCPCNHKEQGCGLEGPVQQRKYSDGTQHVRKCPCRQCLGRRSKKSGGRAQSKAATALGVPILNSMRPGHEEQYGGTIRMEAKSGSQVKAVWTAYLKAEAQSELARPVGDTRPFVMSARVSPTGKDGLLVIRESHLNATVYALAVQLGMIEP